MSTTTEGEARLLRGTSYDNIVDTVFNTPLVKLRRVAPQGANIYVKCEVFNPMASVKDRIGRAHV